MIPDELLCVLCAVVVLLGIAKAFASGFEAGRRERRNGRAAAGMNRSTLGSRTPRLPVRGANEFGELD